MGEFEQLSQVWQDDALAFASGAFSSGTGVLAPLAIDEEEEFEDEDFIEEDDDEERTFDEFDDDFEDEGDDDDSDYDDDDSL